MKHLSFTILACIFLSPIFAQNGLIQLLKGERGLSKQLVLLSEKEQTAFNPARASSIFGLDPNSDLVIMDTETDKLGFTHYRYYQTYKSIPIENAMYIAHTKGGLLTSAGGSIVTDFVASQAQVRTTASVSSQQAIEAALKWVHAERWAWQDSAFEQELKKAQGAGATYYPVATTVWYGGEQDINPSQLKLAYKIDVYSLKPLDRKYIFIDVQNGRVLGQKVIMMPVDAINTVTTVYSGAQSVHSDLNGSTYRLRDYSNGKSITTLNALMGGSDYSSTTSNWSTLSGFDRYAQDVHYGVSATWSFYKNNFNRNSVDNKGYQLVSYVNDASALNNAYWNGNSMHFGNLSSDGKGVVAIDVVGHELTHGITQFTSNLTYSSESGAMNESMSDIMGKSVQFYTKPTDINWQLSNDMSWFIRDMSNPNAKAQPDTYMGTYWHSTTDPSDNYGVHTNSGVGNFMFYLLAMGGSGQNDLGNSYTVSGIGLNKAGQILYRTNTTYLSPNSKYADWRVACIQAATDLYSAASNEVIQVMNAWYAVGVGAAASPCSGVGTNICASQNVPYTTKPALLTGQDAPPSNKVFRWEYNYSGNDNDWHTISGQEGKNFQPWDCWQTVYYRRVILWELTNIWGQKYHEFYANSNVVTIIPYVALTPGLYKIRNRNSGQVLEIGGGGSASITDGTRANQWPSVGTANQEWNIMAFSNGVYKIINRNSGRALEIGGSTWGLTQPGTGANQWPYWEGKNQHWLFQPVYGAPGYFTITNANSGQILEIGGGVSINAKAGAYANQWPYAGENFYEEHWELVPVTVPTSTRFPGVYTIKNVNSQKLLEIGGAATNNGATANQWSDMGTASQQWTLVDAGNGRFNIINRNSGLPIEIVKSSLSYTAQVDQWAMGSNSLNQQWTVEETTPGSGMYKIFNANSTQALEVAYASTSNGAIVTQYPYANVPHHHWILTLVSQNLVGGPSTDNKNQQSQTAKTIASGTDHQLETAPKLSLYPTPASTVLNLRLSGMAKFALVKISDMRGAVILTMRNPSSNQVDISSLTAGVYLVTVSDGKQEYHQRFIKQ